MRQIVLDTETTGLELADGHRIIEIGCIELLHRRATGRHWHRYLRPGREVDPGALAVHGISNEFLAAQPAFADVAAEFLAFVDGAELVIHNAEFDLAFLSDSLRREGAEGDVRAGSGRYLVEVNPALARSLRARFQRAKGGHFTTADGFLEASPAAKLMAVPFVGEWAMKSFGDGLLEKHQRRYFVAPDRFESQHALFEAQLRVVGTKRAILETMRRVPLQAYLPGYRALGATGRPARGLRARAKLGGVRGSWKTLEPSRALRSRDGTFRHRPRAPRALER